MKNNTISNLKYQIKNHRLAGRVQSLGRGTPFYSGVTKVGTNKQDAEYGKYSVGLAERARCLVRGQCGFLFFVFFLVQ